jgi:dimethylhistidine N-methyltransferase
VGTEAERFLEDVLCGLAEPRKAIPCKWLYDQRGSELYERITDLPEYYPARTEAEILDRHAREISAAIGPGAIVFEYGAGSMRKTARLIAALDRPAAYVPVDISREALLAAAAHLVRRFPALPVRPVWADFTEDVPLPLDAVNGAARVAFFPGSTIGNFEPSDAVALLSRMRREVGPGGALLIGQDLPKEAAVLVRAYDDAEGVTAAFNRNLLVRANRELGADFRLPAFRHRAIWDARRGRIEMHLESVLPQRVLVAGRAFELDPGETIHTENAYKWEPRAFDALAAIAGWRADRCFTDRRAWFAVKLYRAG